MLSVVADMAYFQSKYLLISKDVDTFVMHFEPIVITSENKNYHLGSISVSCRYAVG